MLGDKEAEKRFIEVWAKEVLDTHEESLQRLIKEGWPNHQISPKVLQL